ncbi:hypothetical protein DL93DRAFT_1877018 [Clavulina sp. PMI_390]|nr:hypothetical protein DL93DRAFT_1877018 [Clavulina sp. PMI_390]
MPCMYSNLQEYALEQDSERGQLIRDVCSGVGYLHQNRQVHGDLHWGNVLIERLPNATRALLADFGMSRVTFANQNSTSTEAYWSKMVLFMPLEIRQVVNANLQRRMERGTTSGAQETEYKIRPDLQTDIFSFAVVIMALSVASLRSRVGDLNTQESGMLDSEVNRLRSNSYLPQLVYFGVRDFDGFMVLIRRMLSDTKATRPSMTEHAAQGRDGRSFVGTGTTVYIEMNVIEYSHSSYRCLNPDPSCRKLPPTTPRPAAG